MEERIRKYAKFLLEGCLNLTKNDKLFVNGISLIKDFIDIVLEEARKLGIEEIECLITDVEKQKELYKSLTYEELIMNSNFDKTIYNKMAREGYSFLNIYSPVPGFFEEINEDLISKVNQYQMSKIEEYREYQNKGLIKWTIASVPNKIWLNSDDETKLWELILDICLINKDNPLEEWQRKIDTLNKRAEYLNSLKIRKLIFKNSLGTDLEIGLSDCYLFQSAKGNNLVNMPTEEIFTSPNKYDVNGIVYSSKPLIHNGSIIDNFWLKFIDGKIVDYDALKGKKALKGIIETDEGAKYLGEVALVDFSSPISKTGIVFNNTLYDENASCHLALGLGFLECIEDGLRKTKEELENLGLNDSCEHVDFFIGTEDLEVIAILDNNERIKIMEKGNFMEVNDEII